MIAHQKESFLRYLRFERRLSPKTSEAYERDLGQLTDFLDQTYALTETAAIERHHLRSWFASLKEAGQKERSINRKMATLRSFFRFLIKTGVLKESPVATLQALSVPDRLPVYLRTSETEALMEAVDFGTDFEGYTARLICSLLYTTGMRREELIRLRLGDVEWSLKQLRIMGKGGKERLVPLADSVLEEITFYLEERQKLVKSDQDRLLIRKNGEPLYPMYLYRIVHKYLGLVSSVQKRSPHVLRHTFATQLLTNGANIQAIKDLLGHTSLAATQVYTHNQIERLKEIHKMNHPRG